MRRRCRVDRRHSLTVHPNFPAAVAYLSQQAAQGGYGVERMQRNAAACNRRGCRLYFTVLLYDTPAASLVKVCEDRSGRVTGASNVSRGDTSCKP